jgi:hypothetical protein
VALAEREAKLKAELEALQQIQSTLVGLRDIYKKFPGLRPEIAEELASLVTETKAARFSDRKSTPIQHMVEMEERKFNVDRIIAWLRERDEPATAQQIAESLEIPLPSVRHTLYVRHANRFRTVEREGKNTWWRAATPAELKEGGS